MAYHYSTRFSCFSFIWFFPSAFHLWKILSPVCLTRHVARISWGYELNPVPTGFKVWVPWLIRGHSILSWENWGGRVTSAVILEEVAVRPGGVAHNLFFLHLHQEEGSETPSPATDRGCWVLPRCWRGKLGSSKTVTWQMLAMTGV